LLLLVRSIDIGEVGGDGVAWRGVAIPVAGRE
jgi:hypothetical protein